MATKPSFHGNGTEDDHKVMVKKICAFPEHQMAHINSMGKKLGSAAAYLRKLVQDDIERNIALERDYRH